MIQENQTSMFQDSADQSVEAPAVKTKVRGKVCLAKSPSKKNPATGRKELISRIHAFHEHTKGKGWRLDGHSLRAMMSDCTFPVTDKTVDKIRQQGAKTPCAHVQGELTQTDISDEQHEEIMRTLSENGGVYISFDPFKTRTFVITPDNTAHLPEAALCENLTDIQSADKVYLFEQGCIAFNPTV